MNVALEVVFGMGMDEVGFKTKNGGIRAVVVEIETVVFGMIVGGVFESFSIWSLSKFTKNI